MATCAVGSGAAVAGIAVSSTVLQAVKSAPSATLASKRIVIRGNSPRARAGPRFHLQPPKRGGLSAQGEAHDFLVVRAGVAEVAFEQHELAGGPRARGEVAPGGEPL